MARADFSYVDSKNIYADTACQSLRPTAVIKALEEYYIEYNSCGERVKYKWGEIVDNKVDGTREAVLDLLKLPKRKYFTSFTQNTTYGLNLIQSQIKQGEFDAVITTDIEHNSVFLSSIVFGKKHKIPRIIIERNDDGSIDIDKFATETAKFNKILFIANAVSNIDGRRLENVAEIVKLVHKNGGRMIIDASQTMAHSYELLQGVEADAICFSAHKMYSSSLGAIVFRKDFLDSLEISFIGGGMVDDVNDKDYVMSYKSPNHIHTVFEAGLQAYGEIIALGAAVEWLKKQNHVEIDEKAQKLYGFLKNEPKIELLSQNPAPVMSFHIKGLDSHLLAQSLSNEGIMARSGYFCCHYYLDFVKKYPALLRLSLGYHNTDEDIDKIISTISSVL